METLQLTITNQEIKNTLLNLIKKQTIKALKVPIKKTNIYHKKLKLLNMMYQPLNIQKILYFNLDKDYKLILLSRECQKDKLQLTPQQEAQVEVIDQQVTLNFDSFTNQQIFDIFQSKYPIKQNQSTKIPFPNSFETAGHIAHYNLTPQQTKYSKIIGQITLLRCPNIKTVVNKTQKLHNVYRTPTLQHMAGQKGKYLVQMKQVGVSFQLDFEKVYWCSRLQQQRDRLLKIIKPKQLLADIFCGVGPLAVRAAHKGVYVIANDLNPYCHEYLVKNAIKNKVQEKMKCWNMCARQAMRKIYKQHQEYDQAFKYPDHIYMNLPVDAIQFLDVLVDYYQEIKTDKQPLVHVNCFVVANSEEDSKRLLSQRIAKTLPKFKEEDIVTMHHIKNVTVIMRMYCVSFRLKNSKNQNNRQVEKEQQVMDKVQKKRKLQ